MQNSSCAYHGVPVCFGICIIANLVTCMNKYLDESGFLFYFNAKLTSNDKCKIVKHRVFKIVYSEVFIIHTLLAQ